MSNIASQINDLKEKRASLWDENKNLIAAAEAAERDLTAEEAQEYDRREVDMDSLEKRAARLEKFNTQDTPQRQIAPETRQEREPETEVRETPQTLSEYRARQREELAFVQDDGEYREVFYRWMVGGRGPNGITEQESRVLSKASAGAGANLVPTGFARQLVDSLRDFGVMRQISRVITTDSGESLQVPSVSSHGSAAWTAENAAYTASDEVFGQATLSAYKAATLIKVSEELLADSAFDLEAYIRTEFGMRVGVLENTAYVAGDGSGKPTGVATSASAGVTAAGAAAITASELIDLYHSLLPPYRRNAVWMFKDSTIKAVRKLADSTGQFIWQPGLTVGAPDTLLGRPLYADPDMAAATTGLVSVLFGDFSYYWIRDVNGIAFQRLNELYAENGQVGFRAYHRTDGKLMNTAAIKKLTQA